ncbi:MAG: hypothetical protein AABY95_02790 [Pseudomonadota bacterium]
MRNGFVLLCAILLSACNSSEPGKFVATTKSLESGSKDQINTEINRRCTPLGGGAATVEFSAGVLCPECAATESGKSIDGTDETYTSLDAPVGAPGAMTLRATAQPGVTFPAGSNATLTLSTAGNRTGPVSSTGQNWFMIVRTYLAGAVQEEESDTASLNSTEDSRLIVGIQTTKPFDAIEAVFDRSGINPAQGQILSFNTSDYMSDGNARVHEFCGDFDLTGLSEN